MQIPQELVSALLAGARLTVLTGSGVSAESGVPTFRDAQSGLWQRYRPEQLATPEAFRADPKLVWRWYQWRRQLVSRASPNPGHLSLARIQQLQPEFHLVTQNVDGLHQRAGSKDVIEYHGNILRSRCTRDGCLPDVGDLPGEPPACPACGAPVRPDVVWFGEPIPAWAHDEAMHATGNCDVFMAIGTSAAVYPAAGLARLAQQGGAMIVEVNPEATPLSAGADYTLRGPAGTVLPALEHALWPPH